MLIRTQDKMMIINLDNTSRIFINLLGNKVISTFASEAYEELGRYSTREKAVKALDMIEKEYGKYLTIIGGPKLVEGGFDVQPAVYNIPKVFTMPQDEEVLE